MSEGQEDRQGQAITSPEADEGQEMAVLSPSTSDILGNDYLDQVLKERKGKSRSESFHRPPPTAPSTPSTVPSTRPTSEIPDASAPSTAPSTRPTSEIPGAPGPSTAPSTAPSTRPTSEIPGAPGPSTVPTIVLTTGPTSQNLDASAPSTAPSTAPTTAPTTGSISENPDASASSTAPTTGQVSQAQDDKAPSTALASEAVNQAQADPEPSTANVTPSLTEKKHDSAGNAAQGDPGPSTGQAESGSVTGQGDSAAISGISTTEDKPLRKKSTDQVSIAKESSPKAADPKATDAATPQSPSDPPQIGEGAGGSGGSQESQPQKVDAEESQNLEANISMGEQPTEEKAKTEPRRVELGGTSELPGTQSPWGYEGGQLPPAPPGPPLSTPHHRQDITPKPILKKKRGTAAEARLAEEGRAPYTEGFGPDGAWEGRDPGFGTKLFRTSVAKLKATCSSKKVEDDVNRRLNTEMPEEAGTPRLNMEPLDLHPAPAGDSDEDESEDRSRKFCPLKCTCTLL